MQVVSKRAASYRIIDLTLNSVFIVDVSSDKLFLGSINDFVSKNPMIRNAHQH